ncbi:MAG: 16S rRNA (cytosine(1402)-N(4))-methyltransferase RsmH [Rhodothermales bacterium]
MVGSSPEPESSYHVPVLCKAVLEGLITDRSGTYVDATLGGGGHAAAILGELGTSAVFVGIDQDMDALDVCRRRFSEDPRVRLVHGNFGELPTLLSKVGINRMDGILLDLGVSSHQIDTPGRGFSYRTEGPLDMRMNTVSERSAYEFVNSASEGDLRDAIRLYGEEKRAGKIAAAVLKGRPIDNTRAFAEAIASAVPARDLVKTLSRVFQAIRIAVNDELNVLEQALMDSVTLLGEGGRIAVISYHSLEDRRVKHFLRYGNFRGEPVKDLYGNLITPFEPVTRKAVQPDEDECRQNPRARSARLRIAERRAEDRYSPGQPAN